MAEYNESDLVTAGTLDKMLRRFATLIGNPSAAKPHYNAETGRYDNLGDWLSLMADGLVYGVQIPRYAYSPVTTAIKTGANAGLVLEESTETSAGRNDYDGKLLFCCVRVNGGVDADGMPYVTAIEGYDDRFNEKLYNTYALTAVYYYRVTRDASYDHCEYTDTPRTGFKPCYGAYTADGKLRPYILRACYMDSDGTMDSKSGTVPGAWYGGVVDNRVQHCMSNDFSWSKNRSSDGLTYLTYGDITYQEDFMSLMLGVKAPREKAVGCVSYDFQYTVAAAEEGVKRVLLTDAQASNILVGSSVSIGDGSAATTDRYQVVLHNIAKSAKVLSKVAQGDGTTAVNLDLSANVDIPATATVKTMPWRNGSCDGVLGTFGSMTAAGLTNGRMPFKFQNVEWNLGLYETLVNMYSTATVEETEATHLWRIAPDISACTGINAGAGWTALDQKTTGQINNWRYIKDYVTEKGARVPENVAGTSTTGYRTAWYPSASAGDRATFVGGPLYTGAHAGVGCVLSYNALSSATWHFGGRSSAVGHSAPAE
ncbi:hypothetical protein [Adlercreutzia sp. ZJ242]|uniref:hypothetical protein n=1 Tax=Adlercreutzia sp. ZJ242 TaxID=2709409 RepID=UPI0013EB0937|nr:hypothetical protein [Adlercreutzia sp. ZJ242]